MKEANGNALKIPALEKPIKKSNTRGSKPLILSEERNKHESMIHKANDPCADHLCDPTEPVTSMVNEERRSEQKLWKSHQAAEEQGGAIVNPVTIAIRKEP